MVDAELLSPVVQDLLLLLALRGPFGAALVLGLRVRTETKAGVGGQRRGQRSRDWRGVMGYLRVCVCYVCVCLCVRCVYVCQCLCVFKCVCASVHACVHVCV